MKPSDYAKEKLKGKTSGWLWLNKKTKKHEEQYPKRVINNLLVEMDEKFIDKSVEDTYINTIETNKRLFIKSKEQISNLKEEKRQLELSYDLRESYAINEIGKIWRKIEFVEEMLDTVEKENIYLKRKLEVLKQLVSDILPVHWCALNKEKYEKLCQKIDDLEKFIIKGGTDDKV